MVKCIHKLEHTRNNNGCPKHIFVCNELNTYGDWKKAPLVAMESLEMLASSLADIARKSSPLDWTYAIPEQAPTVMTLAGDPYFLRRIVPLDPNEIINFEEQYLNILVGKISGLYLT